MKAAASGVFRGIARDLVSAIGTLLLAAARSERLTCYFQVETWLTSMQKQSRGLCELFRHSQAKC
jgi:enamine deaminase RidA (YjgF/YER057c/UK114 family)